MIGNEFKYKNKYKYNLALQKAYFVAQWAGSPGWSRVDEEIFLYIVVNIPLPTPSAVDTVVRVLSALAWKDWNRNEDVPEVDEEKITVRVGNGELVYSASVDEKREEAIYKNGDRYLKLVYSGDLSWESKNAAPRDWARCLAILAAVDAPWREWLVKLVPEEIAEDEEFKEYWKKKLWPDILNEPLD